MMGQDTIFTNESCRTCGGKGRDPRNRKRECPSCCGLGRLEVCANCLQPWPCGGVPEGWMDATCGRPRAKR